MVVVRDVREFARKNEEHLKRFFKYKTGILDRDLMADQIQNFYVRLIQTNALETYREDKGDFRMYVMTLLCWSLSVSKQKSKRAKNKVTAISNFKHANKEMLEDVYNYVSTDSSYFRVDGSSTFVRDHEYDYQLGAKLESFRSYIRKTENDTKAHQMVTFIDNKIDGCNSTDIAIMLKVSENMVKIIKQQLKKKYYEWKKKTEA